MDVLIGCFLFFIVIFMIAHLDSSDTNESKWEKWTLEDFKLYQEIELKEFLLFKSEQNQTIKEEMEEKQKELEENQKELKN